ncbi:hypothetical protein ACFL34_03795, partial [Candidatus Sumerlaeota bacterium]
DRLASTFYVWIEADEGGSCAMTRNERCARSLRGTGPGRGGLSFILLFVVAILATVLISSAPAATITVGPTGDYPTIQQAIDNAVGGDTILVSAGVYSEQLVCDRSLILTAATGEQVVLDGGGVGTGVSIQLANIQLLSFTVQNFDVGIEIDAASVFEAHLCNIAGNATYGLLNYNPSTAFNVEDNWWGGYNGPGVTDGGGRAGDEILGFADFAPYSLGEYRVNSDGDGSDNDGLNDSDDDNDGYPDAMEAVAGTDALSPTPAPLEVWVDDDWVIALPGEVVGGHVFGYDAFATIQEGIDGVGIDATALVHVAGGAYPENIVVDKTVSLRGPNATVNPNTLPRGAEAVIELDALTAGNWGALISSDLVAIDGFTIQTTNALATTGTVLLTSPTLRGLRIENNIFDLTGSATGTHVLVALGLDDPLGCRGAAQPDPDRQRQPGGDQRLCRQQRRSPTQHHRR